MKAWIGMVRGLALLASLAAALAGAGSARAAIVLRAATQASAAANDTTLTIATPATAVDDVMIASVAFRPCSAQSGRACTATMTAPAGWTLVNSIDQTQGGGTGGYGLRLFVYRRLVTGAEPASYTWTTGGNPATAGAVGGIASFSGVDTASPIVIDADQNTASGNSHAAPSINTGTVTNTMLVSTHAALSSGTWSRPAGMTEVVDIASRATPDDLGLSLEVNYELRAAAGATGTRTATLSNPPTGDNGAGHMLALRPSAINHIRILHDGSALTCQPETVTVQACTDANCTTLYSGSVTTTLSPAGWVGGDTVTFSGGSTTVQLRKTTSGSVTLGAASTTPTPSNATRCFIGASESCTLTFADSGLVFDVPTLTACKPSAAITVSAVRTDDVTQRCVPAFASVTRSLSFWSTYANPATGTQAVSVNGSAVAGTSPGTALSLSFDANAQATITVSYPDAGQMQLNARYTGSGAEAGLIMNGSDGFVVIPVGLAVYSDDANATCTPASATCSILAKAGDPFVLKVKAACWQSDSDTDLSDNPATANFRMTAIPMTSAVQAPAGGAPATLGTSSFDFVAADAGIHNINQTVSEVGVFRFTATPGAGAYFGAAVPAGTSANVGRFTPHHFSLSGASLVNRSDIGGGTGCSPASSFTYLGEPQRLTFTLTAQNAGGGTTQNYTDAGGFAKLAPSTASWLAIGISPGFGLGVINDPTNASAALRTPLSSRLAVDTSIVSPSGTWVAGTLAGGAHVRVDRAAVPDGPFGLVNFGLAPRDGDGITLASSALNLDADQNGAAERANLGVVTQLRFGRARLDNAYGSELLDLPVRLRLQHWNGVGFVDSGDDTCTLFAASDLALSFPADARNHLAACETQVSLAGGQPGSLKLLKPGAGNDGWVDLRLNLSAASGQTCTGAAATPASAANKSYLRGRWSGTTYDQDPTARATFGAYKAPANVIYLRENY